MKKLIGHLLALPLYCAAIVCAPFMYAIDCLLTVVLRDEQPAVSDSVTCDTCERTAPLANAIGDDEELAYVCRSCARPGLPRTMTEPTSAPSPVPTMRDHE